MRRNGISTISSAALAFVATLGLAACDVSVPDLNAPGLGELEDNPTRTTVAAACTGLLIGTRAGTGATNGYIVQLGVLGREAYNFDRADPRNVSELLEGSLSPASPLGGAFWLNPYSNLRLGDIIQRAKEKVIPAYSEEELNAISGFVKTIRALDFLRVITTRWDLGAVIFTDHAPEEVAPIVSLEEALAETARVLDEGHAELLQGGAAFPFALSNGFTEEAHEGRRAVGFGIPSTTFAQFNRAIRVRVAIYQEDYETARDLLEEPAPADFESPLNPNATFLDPNVVTLSSFEISVNHSFSTGTGDLPNALIDNDIWAHQSVVDDAQPDDARLARKVAQVPMGDGTRGLSSDLKFTLYNRPNDPVPIIRNEDLVLFRAEARWFTGDEAGAIADLNLVRDVSGGLPPLALAPGASDEEFIDALLYERRYSLLFEGHRLIDLRRFGLDYLRTLPIDEPTGDNEEHHINYRWPLPQAECDGRVDEPRCGASTQLPED